MYSLSSSSKEVVSQVDDLLTMKVYISSDLPNELGNTKRFLQDILEEFRAYSNGNIRFFFEDPQSDENLEEQARKDGIQPVQILVWDSFGNDWAKDLKEQLKVNGLKTLKAEYGSIPNFDNINFKFFY